jgi:DNA-binding response OmpR family regulator
MKTPKTNILLCDDDVNLTTVLVDYLHEHGYGVITAADGEEALLKVAAGQTDICLLNVNMTKVNGFEVLETIRKTNNQLPVIMVMPNGAQEDIIQAYKLGCDDYLVKPLSVELLICKVEAVLRRCKPVFNSQEMVFDLGGKHFDALHQTFDGRHIAARENDLLLMLCQNMNTLVDRHLILRTLWQMDNHFAVRSLCVYINHLRHLLQGTGLQIFAVHGKGYKLINSKS